jgi:hypothetical protein
LLSSGQCFALFIIKEDFYGHAAYNELAIFLVEEE